MSARTSRLAALCAGVALSVVPAAPARAAPDCSAGRAGDGAVGRPAAKVAWRAGLRGPTPLWSAPGRRAERRGTARPRHAEWLLVLRAARDRDGRCLVRVRLPDRPNGAAAWVQADDVRLRPTGWRLVVSRRARTLSVYRRGDRVRRFRIVIGEPRTPTPGGLFSIVGVWYWDPAAFLGSYILALTAHSHVLQEFGGGDGRVGIHGRGGASLLDPLGSARSHGCVRLANPAIEWIVAHAGADALPGIPVRVR